jgi:hypothetical protein
MALAQTPVTYLDVLKVHVRGEKRKDYEDAVKRLADVQRRYKGDRWIALGTEYGDSGALMFVSMRESLGAIETAYGAFEKATKEGLGPAAEKVMQDFAAWSSSYTAEIRRRRLDLSVNPPSNPAEVNRMIAESRWIRVFRADLKPGKNAAYIGLWKEFQAELAKVTPPITVLVSENVTGTPALHFGTYHKSLGEMDTMSAAVQKAIASQAYQILMSASSDLLTAGTWEIHRLRPDLSNPPDEIVNLDPAFWKAKPAAAARPKPPAEKK